MTVSDIASMDAYNSRQTFQEGGSGKQELQVCLCKFALSKYFKQYFSVNITINRSNFILVRSPNFNDCPDKMQHVDMDYIIDDYSVHH